MDKDFRLGRVRGNGKGGRVLRGVVNVFGGMMVVLGLGGIAEAVTEHGSFIVAAVVFSVGLGVCLVTMGGSKNGRD